MAKITITQDGGGVFVQAPFHYAFPAKARDLGGTWMAAQKTWCFDERDFDRVRKLCREIYGTDGSEDGPLCNVQVRLSRPDGTDALEDTNELWLLGRQVASRRGRDYRVNLGEGVIVAEGGFAKSGGSAKNPRLAWNSGTVLEVRDVPQTIAEEAAARMPTIVVIQPA